jgi:competence protein ComEC
LLKWFENFGLERDRWPLWYPVLFGCGIALYFAWPDEPAAWPALFLAALVAASVPLLGPGWRWPVVLVLLVALGFGAAALRSQSVEAPALSRDTRPVGLSGQVERVERFSPKYLRLTLSAVRIDGWDEARTPARVRITVRTGGDVVRPGNEVSLRAVLMPPPAPATPGGFDFGRQAWFERLGAVGYAVSRLERLNEDPGGIGWWRIERFRDGIGQRLLAQADGDSGAMAVALATGDRSAISEQALEQLRVTGIAHLLAISGMHIALMTGCVFWAVRFGLACVPGLALRYPIKQWAAVAAMGAGLLYLLVSGATIPTQRAFLASWIVLSGILINRVALTMRLVAIGAGVLLLLAPESLLNVSFQMSFAAVIALVAVYERARDSGWLVRGGDGLLRRAGYYLGAVALTSLVAGTATGFFAAYHFNHVALYGLVTNMIAVPLMGLWIMPCLFMLFLAMPFGLEALPLAGIQWGTDVILRVAAWIASWPAADILVAEVQPLTMVLVVAGGLWLSLWRRSWRVWGLAPILIGLMLVPLGRPADVLVDEKGKSIALRTSNGDLMVLGSRRSFARETWLRRNAQKETPAQVPQDLWCDGLGCVYRPSLHPGAAVAIVRLPEALEEDCARAQVVISAEPARRCRAPGLVIDHWDRWYRGAHEVRLTKAGPVARSVSAVQGDRPWSLYTRRRQGADQ